ncbi:MAG TPA: chorismate lyase [Gammaproteobacteria bacterium]|nr:chorismate lyase [Gammaproteobacteria bacterium]
MRSLSRVPVSRRSPRWRHQAQWRRGQLPVPLRGWLLDEGSLTDRLRQSCPGGFRVVVVEEGWRRPQPDEARLLGLTPDARAWVRQVRLLCRGRAWVFARTVVPASTFSGPCRRLRHLGSRPLGAWLFARRDLARSPMQLACIQPGSTLHRDAMGSSGQRDALWGRRSVFRVAGRPLLVSEIFLPGLAR